jgi:hypothetical protein
MSRRFRGQQPISFMGMPWLGVVNPGDIVPARAEGAVAGRPDFEDVGEAPVDAADAEAPAAESESVPDAEAAPVKPRRSASKQDNTQPAA